MSNTKSLEEMIEQMQKLAALKDQIEGFTLSASVTKQQAAREELRQMTIDMRLHDAVLLSFLTLSEIDETSESSADFVGRIVNVYTRMTDEERDEIIKRPLRLVIER